MSLLFAGRLAGKWFAVLALFSLAAGSVEAQPAVVLEEHPDRIAVYEDAAPEERLDALLELLRVSNKNHPVESLAFAEKESELIATATKEQRLELGYLLSWAAYFSGRKQQTKALSSQLLADAVAARNRNREAQARNLLAILAIENGEDVAGIKLFRQSIDLADHPSTRAAAHNNLGNFFKDRGAYEQAFAHYSSALQESKDPVLTKKESCIAATIASFELSDINTRLGEIHSAVRDAETALSCAQITDDVWNQVAALTILTGLLLEQDDLIEAEKRSRDAERLAESHENVVMGMASRARALVLQKQGETEEALKSAERSFQQVSDQPLDIIRLKTVVLFAQLHAESGNYAKAIDLLSALEAEARALSLRDLLERILQAQPEIYKRSGQLDQAYEKQVELTEMVRVGLKQSSSRRMALLQSQLEFQRQEQAAKDATAGQRAAEAQAANAKVIRNAVLFGGLLLLTTGYLLIARRFQVRQVAQERAASRLLEEKLSEQSQTLRQQAQENLQLHNEILHTQKMEAVGQLTGGIAHDFNNLMVVVNGAIELVSASKHSKLAEVDRKFLSEAKDAVVTGTVITRQLLAYVRKQPLKPVLTDITDLLMNTTPILERAVGDRIVLIVEPAEEPIWCEIDRSQLVTALLNLVLNARDAIDGNGETRIHCSRESIRTPRPDMKIGEYCKLRVEDTGSGISEADLSRVTDPFFTTKQLGNGHGLGLSIIHGFVKQSNGDLLIESELGQGTQVTLWLPLCAAPATIVDAAPTSKQFKPSDGDRSILVVEDQPQVLKMAETLLASLGYEVRTASNGEEAQDLLMRGLQVDVVFSDLSMPGKLDGLQLASWLSVERPDLPVLLTSGYPQGQIRLPGVLFISKPYRSEELFVALERVIQKWPDRNRQ